MKNLVWIFGILVIGMIYLAGCGSNKNDNNQVPATAACPVGFYYSNGQCLGGPGIPAQSASFAYNYGFWADNHSGYSRLNFTNSAKTIRQSIGGLPTRTISLTAWPLKRRVGLCHR